MGGSRGRSKRGAVGRRECNPVDCYGNQSCKPRSHAQEKLSSLRAASEAHQRFAGAAPQSHGPEEATRVSRASRASGANSAEILGACRELPGQELLVPGGDGLGLRDQVQRLPR